MQCHVMKQRGYTFIVNAFNTFPNVNIRFYYIKELKSFFRKFGVLEHRHKLLIKVQIKSVNILK